MTPKIILASGSKQRKLIMDSLGIPYIIIPADIDEKLIRDEDLKIRAEKIARAKAEIVVKENTGIVIAADTFIFCNGKVLEKPENFDKAKEMLKFEVKNKMITVYSGFSYIDKNNEIDFSTTSISNLYFRDISDKEINNFVENNPVLQWSAAFCPLYIYQATFIKRIEGSITSVYGLPTDLLIEYLKKSGVEIKGTSI
jgi:septum formation protein